MDFHRLDGGHIFIHYVQTTDFLIFPGWALLLIQYFINDFKIFTNNFLKLCFRYLPRGKREVWIKPPSVSVQFRRLTKTMMQTDTLYTRIVFKKNYLMHVYIFTFSLNVECSIYESASKDELPVICCQFVV